MESFLVSFTKMDKIYIQLCHEAVLEYNLTRNEVLCLLFLQNNQPFNSARDIAQYRKLSKGLIAKSVNSLEHAGYLTVEKDAEDNRIQRLYPTKSCAPILAKLKEARNNFHKCIMAGISVEDQLLLEKISQKMLTNLEGMISWENK